MKLPGRVDGLLHRLRDALDGTVPEYDATELIDAIDAVLGEDPRPRPHRRIEMLIEMQADSAVDHDGLTVQLDGWLEDIAGAQSDSFLRVSSESGSLTLCVTVDPDAASGAGYMDELEDWNRRDDADRA